MAGRTRARRRDWTLGTLARDRSWLLWWNVTEGRWSVTPWAGGPADDVRPDQLAGDRPHDHTCWVLPVTAASSGWRSGARARSGVANPCGAGETVRRCCVGENVPPAASALGGPLQLRGPLRLGIRMRAQRALAPCVPRRTRAAGSGPAR